MIVVRNICLVALSSFRQLQEISSGMHELDRSRNEALSELEQLYNQKDDLEQCLDNLKRNLQMVSFCVMW